MFRDREKALERLSRQLLEEEDPEDRESETAGDWDEEEEADEPTGYRVYNTDITDVDLDAFSDQVYEEPKKSRRVILLLLLVVLGMLLFLVYLFAKEEGLL